MLLTHGIEFSYNNTTGFHFPDISCNKGEHWLIMGASGCGKTTLLHIMAGLLRPNKGSVIVDGINLTELAPAEVDRIRGTKIGIIFQRPHFIQSLTAAENLLIARFLNNMGEDKKQVKQLLERLNIGDKYDAKVNELSQGEQQRLSIARALINNPSVILADEPTSNLDDYNCMEALTLLKSQAQANGVPLIIVTHDHRLSEHFHLKFTM